MWPGAVRAVSMSICQSSRSPLITDPRQNWSVGALRQLRRYAVAVALPFFFFFSQTCISADSFDSFVRLGCAVLRACLLQVMRGHEFDATDLAVTRCLRWAL